MAYVPWNQFLKLAINEAHGYSVEYFKFITMIYIYNMKIVPGLLEIILIDNIRVRLLVYFYVIFCIFFSLYIFVSELVTI